MEILLYEEKNGMEVEENWNCGVIIRNYYL
jgi:hypothetical protein